MVLVATTMPLPDAVSCVRVVNKVASRCACALVVSLGDPLPDDEMLDDLRLDALVRPFTYDELLALMLPR